MAPNWEKAKARAVGPNPANEPVPQFADRWFERWNSGDDVTLWYTAQPVA
jgi:hypothetical protein